MDTTKQERNHQVEGLYQENHALKSMILKLNTQLAEQQEKLNKIERKFTSTNDNNVDRISVKRSEWYDD